MVMRPIHLLAGLLLTTACSPEGAALLAVAGASDGGLQDAALPAPDLAPSADLTTASQGQPDASPAQPADLADAGPPCNRAGQLCCAPSGTCDDPGLVCESNVREQGGQHCRTCGQPSDPACALAQDPGRCFEPCCKDGSCNGGVCLRSISFAHICVTCGQRDPLCTACGHAGEPCCLGMFCTGILECTGPDQRGRFTCG